ncbi:MAG: hypothetical protein K6G16_02195 [Lachnospiraceae bacterium]|nr:hypothetical protein [Lachnospiraceae bacterium]
MRRLFRKAAGRLASTDGQTFILVMTVTALATVLGIMAMSSALMSVRLRGMKRLSDKNFYHLELATQEIRAGILCDVTAAVKKSGEEDWRIPFLQETVGIRDLSVLSEENAVRMSSRREAAAADAAAYLAEFSVTIPVTGSVKRVQDRTEEMTVSAEDVQVDASGRLVFRGVRFRLVNYERDAQSEILCDLVLTAPEEDGARLDEVVRFENWQRIG